MGTSVVRRSGRGIALLVVGLLASLLGPPSSARAAGVIYVVAGGAGTGTGASWANAKDLAPALASAVSGDELWVKAGTYTPSTAGLADARTATFTLKSGVALYGGFAGSETQRSQRKWQTNVTILSGDIGQANTAADNSYHVVTSGGASATAVLDGFTIQGGNANGARWAGVGGGMLNISSSPTLTNLTVSGNSAGLGGGMLNISSSPTLANVTVSGNKAGHGGGMYNQGGRPTLTNVTLSGNTTALNGGGGGMYNAASSPTLTNVTVSGNAAKDGGGMYNQASSPTLTNVTFSGNKAEVGGGIYNNLNSSPTLTNVTFSGNKALFSGGGIYNNLNSSPTLTNVTFSGNAAGGSGGGMQNRSSSPTLTNVVFSGNAANGGGGMDNAASSPTLTNVTFSGNKAAFSGGGMYNSYSSSPTIRNSILWGNTGGEISNIDASTPTVAYSDVQGGYAGTGNLNVDPLFVTPVPAAPSTAGNLRLQAGSPAINAGDPDATGLPSTDLDGTARIQGGRVDLGAYEHP